MTDTISSGGLFSVLSTASQGLTSATDRLAGAASALNDPEALNLIGASPEALNAAADAAAADPTSGGLPTIDIVDIAVETITARAEFAANAAVVETTDELLGETIDILA